MAEMGAAYKRMLREHIAEAKVEYAKMLIPGRKTAGATASVQPTCQVKEEDSEVAAAYQDGVVDDRQMSQQECVHHNKLEEPATESKCGRGRQSATVVFRHQGLHQELKKGKGKSSLCAEQAVAAGVGASFRANLNQQGAVQLLEDSAGQLGEARIQKLDAQHKLKQKEVEALLSKRDAGRMAYLLRNRDAQVAYLERRVQRLVSALRPYTCCCKKGACITGCPQDSIERQKAAAKAEFALLLAEIQQLQNTVFKLNSEGGTVPVHTSAGRFLQACATV
ncbi:hypothetical protein WJX77_002160 [Trebouxia sp. C0004]